MRAVLILAHGALTGGTAYTLRVARELERPCLVVPPDVVHAPGVQAWLARHEVAVLNVAGPRESAAPGIYAQARAFLLRVLRS